MPAPISRSFVMSETPAFFEMKCEVKCFDDDDEIAVSLGWLNHHHAQIRFDVRYVDELIEALRYVSAGLLERQLMDATTVVKEWTPMNDDLYRAEAAVLNQCTTIYEMRADGQLHVEAYWARRAARETKSSITAACAKTLGFKTVDVPLARAPFGWDVVG